MNTIVANLALGFLWIGLTGRTAVGNYLLGLVIGYLVLRATEAPNDRTVHLRKLSQMIGFTGFFLKDLVVSTLRVARDALRPTHYLRPAIIGVPLDAKTDVEITLLACMITLTPGSLTLDVSDDRKTLFVHAMYVHDYDSARAAIKTELERRILELVR